MPSMSITFVAEEDYNRAEQFSVKIGPVTTKFESCNKDLTGANNP